MSHSRFLPQCLTSFRSDRDDNLPPRGSLEFADVHQPDTSSRTTGATFTDWLANPAAGYRIRTLESRMS
jgi:hypothetical protein